MMNADSSRSHLVFTINFSQVSLAVLVNGVADVACASDEKTPQDQTPDYHPF